MHCKDWRETLQMGQRGAAARLSAADQLQMHGMHAKPQGPQYGAKLPKSCSILGVPTGCGELRACRV